MIPRDSNFTCAKCSPVRDTHGKSRISSCTSPRGAQTRAHPPCARARSRAQSSHICTASLDNPSFGPHQDTLHPTRARGGAFGHASHTFEKQRVRDTRACSLAPARLARLGFRKPALDHMRTAGTACEPRATPCAAPPSALDDLYEKRRLRRLVRQVAVIWRLFLHRLDGRRSPGRTRKQGRAYTRARAE